jgi:hypothetical protein
MSAKSIGYSGVKLVAGSYTQALLTLSSSKQILGIQSQDLTGDADDLIAEVDSIGDTITTIETTQSSIKDKLKEVEEELETIDIAEEESTYETQLETYQTLLTKYNALATKPIAEIVKEVSTTTLAEDTFGPSYQVLEGPFNLTEGTYSVCCSFQVSYGDDVLPSVNVGLIEDGLDIQTGYQLGIAKFDGNWKANGDEPYVVCSGAFEVIIPKNGLDVNLIIAGSPDSEEGATGGRVADNWTPDFGLQDCGSEYEDVKANPPPVFGSSRAIQIVKLNSDVNPSP